MKLILIAATVALTTLLVQGSATAQNNPDDRDTTQNTGGPKGTSGTVGVTEKPGPTTGDTGHKAPAHKKNHHAATATPPASPMPH
ncbi:hypothetical protein [Caulobacter sp. S45]|uniref:hypothetical protein n=1 Tax=Caulobacter sp. S45 TaxID=1641861 RepID=UPI00131ADB80|nr:hypothetical protein [Caulobacter sp. S45]